MTFLLPTASSANVSAVGSRGRVPFVMKAKCKALSTADCIEITPGRYASEVGRQKPLFILSLNPDMDGELRLNSKRIEADSLQLRFVRVNGNGAPGGADEMELTAVQAGSRAVHLIALERPLAGRWCLEIPAGYLEVSPAFVEVDSIPYTTEELINFSVAGAWHKPGKAWEGTPMFTIHDDDGIDGYIPSSGPGEGMTTGYFSILYPVLESLGLSGCVSLEGRRAGWTAGKSNDNVAVLRRLQDERGWEVQSHSMLCLGEKLLNWQVESQDSPLADYLLETGANFGPESSSSVSIYDVSLGKQLMPLADRSRWVEADSVRVRPYVGEYETGTSIMYNTDFSVPYHWGEWFRQAEKNGIKGRSWVTHNTSSCHANVPLINAVCPNGFADMMDLQINYPPLLSTATRLMLEGQIMDDYEGEHGSNKRNEKHYKFFRSKIDEAAATGGWIVMGLHAYRECWRNSLPGALVSEGGAYPDEWVNPMAGVNPLQDSLTPPAHLGIGSWSEWYPCPGTRLHMVWELLKYARDLGMLNVTSAEGFEAMGNKIGVGYYNRGYRIGQDVVGLEDTRDYYPHYVVGANEEVSYFNPLLTERIVAEFDLEWTDWDTDYQGRRPDYFDTSGRRLPGIPPSGIVIMKRWGDTEKIIR